MKNVIKNVIKSICSVCLILQIISTLYLGIMYFETNKAIENNDNEIISNLVEVGKSVRNDLKSKSEEEEDRAIGVLTLRLAIDHRFKLMKVILMFSVVIGSIIGIAKSIDENSNKKVIITYILMYLVIILIVELYVILTYGKIDINNLIGIAIETFVVYTVIYVLTLLKKRLDNSKKVKIMNQDLK